MHVRPLLVLLTLALFGGVAHADIPFFNPLQKKLLEQGKVLVTPTKPTDDSGVAAYAVAVIKAPVAKVWPVVRDCQHFKKFMPRTKVSKLISRNGNKAVCFMEISMPFPLSNLHSEVDSIETELAGGGFKRSWKLRKGNYKRNSGSWALHPWEQNKDWTLIVYRIDVDPDMVIPDAILRKAQTGSLPDVFKAIRKRVGA